MKTIKNTIKGVLAGAMIVLAMSANATDNYFKLKVVSEKTFNLSVSNVNGAASVSIVDSKGAILYNEQMRTEGELSKNFDLSSLPYGNYQLTYSDEFKSQSVNLLIGETLTFGQEKIRFVPTVNSIGSAIKVGLLSQSESSMKVSVYDDNNNLIISEVIRGNEYLGKSYDLSKVRKGTYNVVVAAQGKTYYRTVKI